VIPGAFGLYQRTGERELVPTAGRSSGSRSDSSTSSRARRRHSVGGRPAVRTITDLGPSSGSAPRLGAPANAVPCARRAPTIRERSGWSLQNPPVRLRLATETGQRPCGTAVPSLRAAAVRSPEYRDAGDGGQRTSRHSQRVRAVRLTGTWRRFAIAWRIQSWGLLRGGKNAKCCCGGATSPKYQPMYGSRPISYPPSFGAATHCTQLYLRPPCESVCARSS